MGLRRTLEIVGAIAIVYEISFCGRFPKAVRDQVRREQRDRCAWCGTSTSKTEIHHICPDGIGGAKRDRFNAVGLCKDCHDEWDKRATPDKIRDAEVYPGIPLLSIGPRYYEKGKRGIDDLQRRYAQMVRNRRRR